MLIFWEVRKATCDRPRASRAVQAEGAQTAWPFLGRRGHGSTEVREIGANEVIDLLDGPVDEAHFGTRGHARRQAGDLRMRARAPWRTC